MPGRSEVKGTALSVPFGRQRFETTATGGSPRPWRRSARLPWIVHRAARRSLAGIWAMLRPWSRRRHRGARPGLAVVGAHRGGPMRGYLRIQGLPEVAAGDGTRAPDWAAFGANHRAFPQVSTAHECP